MENLRPCEVVVENMVKDDSFYVDSYKELRKTGSLGYVIETERTKALWHKWYIKDGMVYAIVEYEDGKTDCAVLAEDIHFLDHKFDDFLWEGEISDD